MATETFDSWAIVELFGHQVVAGRVLEQVIGGETFIRVDIPRGDAFYTRCFGKGAIYCLNICEEDTARKYANRMSSPVAPYVALPAPEPSTRTGEDIARSAQVQSAITGDDDDEPGDYDDEPPI